MTLHIQHATRAERSIRGPRERRTETWLALIAVAIGLLIAAFLGLWALMSALSLIHI